MRVGLIGYRGMVGSVLLERMQQEQDFTNIDPIFFSTTDLGRTSPQVGKVVPPVQDPFDIDLLSDCDIIISCRGSDYTRKVYPELRGQWGGYWIDASSLLRMQDDVIISLDPINHQQIQQGIDRGIKTFVGANCTVSLMLLSLHGLFKENLVNWVSLMTYQAISGAGAKKMGELFSQADFLNSNISSMGESVLDIENNIKKSFIF